MFQKPTCLLLLLFDLQKRSGRSVPRTCRCRRARLEGDTPSRWQANGGPCNNCDILVVALVRLVCRWPGGRGVGARINGMRRCQGGARRADAAISFLKCGHPVPTQAGLDAGAETACAGQKRGQGRPGDLLLSGGVGSALVAANTDAGSVWKAINRLACQWRNNQRTQHGAQAPSLIKEGRWPRPSHQR